MRRQISLAGLVGLSACLLGAAVDSPVKESADRGSNARYIPLYGRLLSEFTQTTDRTVQTRVNYRGLSNDPRWKYLVALIAQTTPDRLETREERLAYWINIYNIFAIDLIVNAYPVESIKDIGSFFSPVWKKEAGSIHGRPYSLDEIEHKILRPMGEPRIHLAIVCASVSCPPLARTPFLATAIDRQLDGVLASFLANPTKGARLDRKRRTLWLSKIFDWFEEDFASAGGVLAFVLPRLAEDDARWIRAHRAELEIGHLDYDWSLNE